MFGLTTLRNAIGTLAANVLGLAGTVAEINKHLRQRAALDGPEPVETLTLTGNVASPPTVPASVAGTPPTLAQDATDGEGAPTPTRNGRARQRATTA